MFLFFNKMRAPIKRIQNKFRYQVLMRVLAEDKQLLDEIYARSDKYKSRLVLISMEVNSNNLT